MQTSVFHTSIRRRTTGAALALALVATFTPTASRAQTPEAKVDRWAAAAELTLTDTSGNQDLTVLTTGFSLRHRLTELFQFELQLQARYGANDHERAAESYRGTLNFDLTPAGTWSPFFFATAEHDPFKRLDVRVNSGAGAKYRIYKEKNGNDASVSLALLHSYEALKDEAAPATTQSARWSLRVKGQTRLREGVTLGHMTQYQPVYDQFGDYLLYLETNLKVLINSHVALSISHELNRDTTPAVGVGADDRLLKAGVIVEI